MNTRIQLAPLVLLLAALESPVFTHGEPPIAAPAAPATQGADLWPCEPPLHIRPPKAEYSEQEIRRCVTDIINDLAALKPKYPELADFDAQRLLDPRPLAGFFYSHNYTPAMLQTGALYYHPVNFKYGKFGDHGCCLVFTFNPRLPCVNSKEGSREFSGGEIGFAVELSKGGPADLAVTIETIFARHLDALDARTAATRPNHPPSGPSPTTALPAPAALPATFPTTLQPALPASQPAPRWHCYGDFIRGSDWLNSPMIRRGCSADRIWFIGRGAIWRYDVKARATETFTVLDGMPLDRGVDRFAVGPDGSLAISCQENISSGGGGEVRMLWVPKTPSALILQHLRCLRAVRLRRRILPRGKPPNTLWPRRPPDSDAESAL